MFYFAIQLNLSWETICFLLRPHWIVLGDHLFCLETPPVLSWETTLLCWEIILFCVERPPGLSWETTSFVLRAHPLVLRDHLVFFVERSLFRTLVLRDHPLALRYHPALSLVCITCIKWTTFEGPSWSWSYGSWIYNYLCNQCLSPLKLWVRTTLMAWCSR